MMRAIPLVGLLAACAPEPPPPAPPPGPLSHQHRVLGDGTHFLLITAEPGPAEPDKALVDRIRVASADLAAGLCPEGYDVIAAPTFEGYWLERMDRRTESYLFACR